MPIIANPNTQETDPVYTADKPNIATKDDIQATKDDIQAAKNFAIAMAVAL